MREPSVLDYLRQLLPAQLTDPAGAQQHRWVTIEVRRGEERRRGILNQGLLVGYRWNPEHDHVLVAFGRFRIDGVRARVAEERERLAAHLVDRIAAGSMGDYDVRHSLRQLMDILHSGPPRPRHEIYANVGSLDGDPGASPFARLGREGKAAVSPRLTTRISPGSWRRLTSSKKSDRGDRNTV